MGDRSATQSETCGRGLGGVGDPRPTRETQMKGEAVMQSDLRLSRGGKGDDKKAAGRDELPELYQVVIECRDEGEQRELFERLRGEGRRVRLMVL